MSAITSTRDVWVDHVRTAMVFLVVNIHACVTYSHVGGWYVNEGGEPPLSTKVPFFFWQGHVQAFFMGLLFFLGGCYAARSLARKSGLAFILERFRRLMVPTIFYMGVIYPLMMALVLPYGPSLAEFPAWLMGYYRSFRFLWESGPLWFAITLFVFCAGLTLFSRRCVSLSQTPKARPPRLVSIVGFGALLAVGTFLVRT